MHRRTVLAKLGALLAGSGALLGSSAFDSVRAGRAVTVETAGDADALLGLEPGPDGEDYLVGDGQDGPLALDLTGHDGGEGVNRNGITAIDRLVTVTNNGTKEVSVGFRDEYAIDEGDYDEDELPGGWAYAVGADEEAAVVVWACPVPADMDKSVAEVRPDLVTTGFEEGSTLVDGRIDNEVGDRSEREILPGERINVGVIIDTRASTVEENDLPEALEDSVTLLARDVE
ncbi:hypothetical protein ACYJ1Y_05495 [Natrialbaceae archaeon A-gly3]